MKKSLFIIFIFLFLSFFNSFAQNHLKIKGIEINGTLPQFVDSLKMTGFTVEEINSTYAVLTGPFLGYKNVELIVAATPISGTVYAVNVWFAPYKEWAILKSIYEHCVETIETKYNVKGEAYHNFHWPYKEGDGNEIFALYNNKLEYSTGFTLNEGAAIVMIRKTENFKEGQVLISYTDKINSNIWEKEQYTISSNDL